MVFAKDAVRSIDVASGDAVIEAKVAGDGPAVVMLAGHSRGVSDLAELMEALAAAGHHAVGINIRGAEGSSGPFDKLTTEMMVWDIEAVAQALGLGRSTSSDTRLAGDWHATSHPATPRRSGR